jgi:hypothetical protein
MAKFLTEILDEINEDVKKLNDYKDDMALRYVFEYAFDEDKKMDLPDGEPPFKPDGAPDFGMSPANLRMETKKFYVYNRKDLKALRKEQLFIGLLEAVHPKEAKLLIAIKDQKLEKMYPKITRTVLEGLGFIKPKAKKEDK